MEIQFFIQLELYYKTSPIPGIVDPCRTVPYPEYVVYMLHMCYIHVLHMLYTCYTHVMYMFIYVVYVLYMCHIHAVYISQGFPSCQTLDFVCSECYKLVQYHQFQHGMRFIVLDVQVDVKHRIYNCASIQFQLTRN